MGVLEDLNEYDFSVLKILEDENERRGDFLRLWPNTKAADHFEYCMKGYNDKLIVEWTANEPNDSRRVTLLQYLLKMSATQNPISDTTSKLLFKGI